MTGTAGTATGPVAGTGLRLVDHHCHGVVTTGLDRRGVEMLLTEGDGAPAGLSAFDTQLGLAVRRWCAPLLGLEPSATATAYIRRRAELGAAEVNRRFLRAARVDAWLVDTGFQPGRLLTPAALARVSGAPAHEIVRLESLAESLAASDVTATGFAAAFGSELGRAVKAAAGLKSVVAYRGGLGFDPSRPGAAEVRAAAGRWLSRCAGAGVARLDEQVLLRHVIWAGVDTGLPLQFHTGFGDPDVRLHRADPSLLHDFLAATREGPGNVLLLHCYPYHRQAGYLANVFPHVYLDVGEALTHVGARGAAVLAETLELAPFFKLLYSSDGFGLPELHYLGAAGFRRDLGRVLSAFVADGAWSPADAERAAHLIGWRNASRVYRLGLD